MSQTPIKLPWIAISERPPEKGSEVLWMDVDGSYHLAKWDGTHVLPAVYGNSDEVRRRLDDHVCWMPIQQPAVKQLAINAIRAAANACASDPQVFEKGAYLDSMQAIADAEAFFVDAIEGRILGETPNPSYMHFDMAVAKLVLLSVEYPELYAQLMANIGNGNPLTSYAGLIGAHAFLNALTDDHSYVLEQDGTFAVITLTDGYLMGPSSLHAFLSRLI